MKYKKVLIALGVAVRIECKISARRPDRQQVLQPESEAWTKIFEKIVECIGNDIGTAVK